MTESEGTTHSAPAVATSEPPAGPLWPAPPPPPLQGPPAAPPPVLGPPPVQGPPPVPGPPPVQGPPPSDWTAAPGYGVPPPQPQPPRGPSRAVRVIVAAIAVIALTVPAGLVGGLIAHRLDSDKTQTPARAAALPAVDRSSLADVVNKVEPSVVSINTGDAEGSG